MSALCFCVMIALVSLGLAQATHQRVVLVTGATGRTGSLAFKMLQNMSREENASVALPRALVRNATKAREILNCQKCDASEGIFLGDVSNITLLPDEAFSGVDAVLIAVGIGADATREEMTNVEWKGVEHQVQKLVENNNESQLIDLHTVLISSMGTSYPHPLPFMGGKDLFYKLQAETFLGSCGISTTVIKPCGLDDKTGGEAQLIVGHDDTILTVAQSTISRTDLAAVVVEAATSTTEFIAHGNIRTDLCASSKGSPTSDLEALLASSTWAWQQKK